MLGRINRWIQRDKATSSIEEEGKAADIEEWYVVWEYEETAQQSRPEEPHVIFSPGSYNHLRQPDVGSNVQEVTSFEITNSVKTTGRGRLMGKAGDTTLAQRELAPESQKQTNMKKLYFLRVLDPVTVVNVDLRVTGRVEHKNIVQILGWCHDQDSHAFSLINEKMSNGSLHTHIHSPHSNQVLCWESRYKIACSLASAILYLHEEFYLSTIHTDINSHNVLLDSDLKAKLTNFGMIRVDNSNSFIEALMLGTSTGNPCSNRLVKEPLSKEANVCSFGNLALEIACGKDPTMLLQKKSSIWQFAMEFYGRGFLFGAVDRELDRSFDQREMERLILVGLLCAQPDPKLRPSIKQATRYLNFEESLPSQLPWNTVSSFLGSCSKHLCVVNEASSSQQLSLPPITNLAPHVTSSTALQTFELNSKIPGEPLKDFEIEIVKGIRVALHQNLQKEMRFEATLELLVKYTQVLVVMGIPTNGWNLLVQEILHVAKSVDRFREECQDPGYEPTSRNLQAIQEEVGQCACSVEEYEKENVLLLRRMGDLQKQVDDLRSQMKDLDEELSLLERRKAQEIQARELKRKELDMLQSAQPASAKISLFSWEE